MQSGAGAGRGPSASTAATGMRPPVGNCWEPWGPACDLRPCSVCVSELQRHRASERRPCVTVRVWTCVPKSRDGGAGVLEMCGAATGDRGACCHLEAEPCSALGNLRFPRLGPRTGWVGPAHLARITFGRVSGHSSPARLTQRTQCHTTWPHGPYGNAHSARPAQRRVTTPDARQTMTSSAAKGMLSSRPLLIPWD